ncbi:MAG: FAD binding domain-containing protein [Methylacidiphilaceae bacterium]|nr:FAD binding domain-containing protein [Candidatus Methylacidiphilaceae bacterium]
MSFSLSINGGQRIVKSSEPGETLLEYVRSIGFTGAKEGCAEGECGACSVLWIEEKDENSRLRAIPSCLVPLAAAANREIYTVDALADQGRLCQAQRAIVEEGGSQCGYCTPGFVVSLFAAQSDRKDGSAALEALSGNLCRCTGYRPIRAAAQRLPLLGEDHFLIRRLASPPPRLGPLSWSSGSERFLRPTRLETLWEMAARSPEGRWAAGMTDLSVERNLRFQRSPCWISLEGIPELRRFRDGAQGIEIGAGLSLRELEERLGEIRNPPPGLQEWFPHFASPLIRNRASLGGNLATASPVGDAAPLLLVLDARLVLLSREESREVSLSAFFLGYRKTALRPGELIVSIRIPKPYPSIVRFYKVAKRQSDDITIVSLGAALDLGPARRVRLLRLAFGGVADRPLRLKAAEEALMDQPWELPAIERARLVLQESLSPIDDHRGSAAYRLAVAQNLLEKFHWQTRFLPN